ncbi:epsilon-toxin family protein [Bacillus thuringiensis]|uniref:epsilon-toxin family protein n=1 Tax=Bacillus thuringiensis TaxID=1428 RepID=UPI001EDDC074|nr:epsilon-toxin family protein [Bacillus thuringiensis]MCG3426406.1 epsilon-toxin family protein [Bacillus thuringiensis]
MKLKVLATTGLALSIGFTSLGVLEKPILADETKENIVVLQSNSIKGYLYKNGVKTPVFESSKAKSIGAIEFPGLPSNPLVGVPKEGKAVENLGSMGNILYFEGDAPPGLGSIISGKKLKYYLEKRADGTIGIGGYDPDTLLLYPILSPDPEIKSHKAFDNNTKLKRETKYELITSDIMDNAVAYSFDKSITHGVSTTGTVGLASTIGAKVSTEIGGGIIPGKVSTELSASLTTSFSFGITITDQETIARHFSVEKVNNPSYQYNKYAVAAYQLKSTYSPLMGAGLEQFIKENPQFKGLSNKIYKYNEEQMYFGVTPGSHIN